MDIKIVADDFEEAQEILSETVISPLNFTCLDEDGINEKL